MKLLRMWPLLLWRFRREARMVLAMLRNRSTPVASKLLAVLALAYLISPIDFLPDIIPLLGWIDDGVIVTFLMLLAFKLMPSGLYQQLRTATPDNAKKQAYPRKKSAWRGKRQSVVDAVEVVDGSPRQ